MADFGREEDTDYLTSRTILSGRCTRRRTNAGGADKLSTLVV